MKFGARLSDSALPWRPLVNTGSFTGGVTDWTAVSPPDGDELGNDDHSNCVQVAIFRWAQLRCAKTYNRKIVIPESAPLQLYSRTTGFNIATGSNDNGTDPNAIMTEWAKNADLFHLENQNFPILWARVHPTSIGDVAAAMAQTPLLMTTWLPEADIDDPDNWKNPAGTGAKWAPSEGHEMVLMRNGANSWAVRTWGRDYEWHSSRLRYVHDLAAPLERIHTDPTKLGLDWEQF